MARSFGRHLAPAPLLAAVALFLVAPAAVTGPFEPAEVLTDYRAKWAILVGVDKYDGKDPAFTDLDFAVNDAREVRDVLRDEFGFAEARTRFLPDAQATLENVRALFTDWLAKQDVAADDAVLVFFAGHGVINYRTREGYLAVHNSRSADPKEGCIPETWVREQLARLPCRHKLIILDSCFSGTLFRHGGVPPAGRAADDKKAARGGKKQAKEALKPIPPPLPRQGRDILAAYLSEPAFLGLSAGRETPVADGRGRGRHSVFTAALLRTLRERANSARPDQAFAFRQLAARVEARVRDSLGSAQVPDWGRLGPGDGDFVFRPTLWRLTPSREAARRRYTAALTAAQIAWEAGDLPRVLQLLEGQRPGPEDEDLRGFEWYYLWRLSHADRRTLRGAAEPVVGLSFSADGQALSACYRGGPLRVWDLASGRARATREWDAEPTAFSADGQTCVVLNPLRGLQVWQRGRAEASATFPPARAGAPVMFFPVLSPDGRAVAWSTQGTNPQLQFVDDLTVWEWAAGRPPATVPTSGPVYRRQLSPDGRQCAFTGAAGTLRVLDVARRAETVLTLNNQPVDGGAVAFSADGKSLAAGLADGRLAVWSLPAAAGKVLAERLTWGVTALAFAPDGRTLATGGDDMVVRTWPLAGGPPGQMYKGHTSSVSALRFAPDGRLLASGAADGVVKVWGLSPPPEASFRTSPVMGLVLAPTGRSAATLQAPPEGKLDIIFAGPIGLKVWDLTKQPPQSVVDFRQGVGSPAFSPDGKFVVAAMSREGFLSPATVKVWDAGTGKELAALSGLRGKVLALRFSSSGERLTGVSAGGTVKIWEVSSWTERPAAVEPPNNLQAAALSADGDLLAVSLTNFPRFQPGAPPPPLPPPGGNSPVVQLWDLPGQRGQRPRAVLEGLAAGTLAFSPDGKLLAGVGSTPHSPTSGKIPALHVWETDTGRALWSRNWPDRLAGVRLPGGRSSDLVFAPDGRVLTALAGANTLRVFDSASGREIASRTLVRSGLGAPPTAFAADGRGLATAEVTGVRLRDPLTLEDAFALKGPGPGLAGLAFSADGTWLVAARREGTVTRTQAAAKSDTPSPLELTLAGLRDLDAEVRRNAADVLPTLGRRDADVVAALARLAHDPVPAVRGAALAALGGLEGEARVYVPVFVEALGDRDVGVRRKAAQALRGVGPGAEAAVKPLLRAVREDAAVARDAFRALVQIDPDNAEAAPALVRHLASPGRPVDEHWEQDAESANLEFRTAGGDLGDFPADVGKCLLRAPTDRARSALYALLRKAGPQARRASPSLVALMKRGDHQATLLLAELAWDDAALRPDLVGGLVAALKAGLPVPPRMAALGPAITRESAARWLGLIGVDQAGAVAQLRQVRDQDPFARPAADLALRLIAAPKDGRVRVLIDRLGGPRDRGVYLALDLLPYYGPGAAQAEPALRQLMAGGDQNLRTAAERALEKIKRK